MVFAQIKLPGVFSEEKLKAELDSAQHAERSH